MIEGNLNHNFCLKDLGYSNYSDSIELPRHRWYYFKEGFSPILVEKAIEDASYGRDDIVVDHFSGSGTAHLVATSYGLQGIGFEVNPFLVFLSRTKLIQLDPNIIDKKITFIEKGISTGRESSLEGISTFSKRKKAEKWLFNTSVLRGFEGGWHNTLYLEKEVRSIFQLALLGAAMDTCNATRDGKCLRYRPDWQELNFTKKVFLNNFLSRIAIIKEDLEKNTIEANKSKIISGDSRKNFKENLPLKFKLCVTSPPYLNSFDYSDIYRPELFLGKFLSSNKQLTSLRLKTIRSHVQAKWENPKQKEFGLLYDEAVRQITERSGLLWNKRIPMMIQAYFEDMSKLLRVLRQRAERNASLWLIVSTSAYVGVEIPVDLIIAEIGVKVGWFLREIGVLRYLRASNQFSSQYSESSGRRLRESVIIFDASIKKA